MMIFQKIHTILYVEDQEKSTAFYEKVFAKKADLNVEGMTEFNLSENFVLGLMPNDGIAKILKDKTPHPNTGKGIPRCELYFYTENLEEIFLRIIKIDAKIISGLEERNWGDEAFYFTDPDGHVIVFARKI